MPPHRNKQLKSTFMWLLKIPLILQLLCYSNTPVIQHRPLNWSACWKMSAQANKISTYVQYRTCGQNKKSVFRHKDTDYPSITVICWKASWDFYVRVLQTQASTPIYVKSCETINDKLRNHKRRALTLLWQYSNLVPQHSHTYPATHLQLAESSTFLLLPEIETGPKGTGCPRSSDTLLLGVCFHCSLRSRCPSDRSRSTDLLESFQPVLWFCPHFSRQELVYCPSRSMATHS